MGMLVKPDTKDLSSAELIYPKNNKEGFTLEELQECVKGYIELVKFAGMSSFTHKLPVYTAIVVNEEGLREQLPFNALASELHGGAVVGNALLVTQSELD